MLFPDNNLRVAAGDLWPATLGDTLGADGNLSPGAGHRAFDTCIALHDLGQATDPCALLSTMPPMLRPGGRAILVADNRRFHRALMRALADIAMRMRALPSAAEDDRGRLLALLSKGRQRQLGPGLFTPEAMRRAAREAGFATADIRPLNPDPTGVRTGLAWLAEAGATADFTRAVGDLVAATGGRYLKLLSATDASESMLVWLTKGATAIRPEPPAPDDPPRPSGTGGLPPHWAIDLLASGTPAGVRLSVGGWCLVNADVAGVAITLDGVRRQTEVRRPRPDVDVAMNQSGLYSAWSALCCGMQDELLFAGVRAPGRAMQLAVEILLENGAIVRPDCPATLTLDRPLLLSA